MNIEAVYHTLDNSAGAGGSGANRADIKSEW